MSLITNNQLQAVLDKLARWATESVGDPEFNAGFNAGMVTANADIMSGGNSLATYILATSNEDVIADLLPAARDLDESNPVPPDGFLITVPGIAKMQAAIAAHLKRYNGAASVDAYLTSLNAVTPTLRAHGHYSKYLKSLKPGNVFIPNDVTLATFTVASATTGTYARVTGIDITKYAGAKLVLKNVGALNSTTGVTLSAKKLDGTTASLTASIATLTDTHETNLSDTTKLYVDTVSIAVTGAMAADVFAVIAKTDRDISAA